MPLLRRALGGYCLVIAAIVAVQLIATPFQNKAVADSVWSILDWFIALSLLVTIGVSVVWRLTDTNTEVSRDYLEGMAILIASVPLALWFVFNWITWMDERGMVSAMLWVIVDPLIVLTVGAAGLRMLRRG